MMMKQRTIAMLMAFLPALASAHPGHGMPVPAHWHAHDAWGWALALGAAALLFWLARRK